MAELSIRDECANSYLNEFSFYLFFFLPYFSFFFFLLLTIKLFLCHVIFFLLILKLKKNKIYF